MGVSSSIKGRWLERDGLNLPNPRLLPNDLNEICIPYYFIVRKYMKKKYKIKYT